MKKIHVILLGILCSLFLAGCPTSSADTPTNGVINFDVKAEGGGVSTLPQGWSVGLSFNNGLYSEEFNAETLSSSVSVPAGTYSFEITSSGLDGYSVSIEPTSVVVAPNGSLEVSIIIKSNEKGTIKVSLQSGVVLPEGGKISIYSDENLSLGVLDKDIISFSKEVSVGSYSLSFETEGMGEYDISLNPGSVVVTKNQETEVAVQVAKKKGDFDISIEDGIKADFDITVTEINKQYSKTDSINASVSGFPAESTIVWYLDTADVGHEETLDLSLSEYAQGKHSLSCIVTSPDEVMASERFEFRII